MYYLPKIKSVSFFPSLTSIWAFPFPMHFRFLFTLTFIACHEALSTMPQLSLHCVIKLMSRGFFIKLKSCCELLGEALRIVTQNPHYKPPFHHKTLIASFPPHTGATTTVVAFIGYTTTFHCPDCRKGVSFSFHLHFLLLFFITFSMFSHDCVVVGYSSMFLGFQVCAVGKVDPFLARWV